MARWWMLVVLLVSGCVAPPTAHDGSVVVPLGTGSSGALVAEAERALPELGVRGRGPRTGYSRAAFGPAWSDVDRNGCDTRNDVLRRDLQEIQTRGRCVVLEGRFLEPYLGREVRFSKSRAGEVQVDHVVALSDAWQKGAARWSFGERLRFANDPLNLLAVSGRANQAKGDADTATWLPPNRSFRCAYVARQVVVKARYRLAVTPAEHAAMTRVLSRC